MRLSLQKIETMKTHILLAFIFLSTIVFGQSIQLEHEGHILQNGEEVVYLGSHEMPDMAIDLLVTNISGGTKEISCVRYVIDTITASALYMCWANCTVIPHGGTVTMQANETTDVFSAHINPNGNYGIERNLYTFYDENNPSDSMSFVATFVTTNFLLLNEEGDEMLDHEIEIWGVNGSSVIYELPSVFNQTDENISLMVEQEIISQTEGSEVVFVWDGIEYSDQSNSAPASVFSGENEGLFSVEYSVGENMGVSIIKYTVYDELNIENAHELTLIFNSTTVGIDESDAVGFNIYPNPSNGHFVINNGEDVVDEIFIYDLQGRLINHQLWNTAVQSQSFDLPNGQYLIQLRTASELSKPQKLVVF